MSKTDYELIAKSLTQQIARTEICDWMVLVKSMDEFPPQTIEQRAKAIADVLRKGEPSDIFCSMLASMIDPSQEGNIVEYKLELSRKDNGRPKGPDWPLAFEMERLVDHVYAHETKAFEKAWADVNKKFGRQFKETKCRSALAAARKWTRLSRLLDEDDAKI